MRNKKRKYFLQQVLMNTPIRKKINNLQNQILQVCPYDQDTVQDYSGQILYQVIVLNVFAVSANIMFNYLLLAEFDCYTVATSILLSYVLACEIVNRKLNFLTDGINRDFGLFLSKMKNEYRASHSIVQSLQTASTEFSFDIQQYTKEIKEILCAENPAALVQTYATNPYRHAYIRIFVKLCYQCMNKGDMTDKINGVSIFSRNIEILRTEISDLVLHNRRQRHKLSGLTLACVLPAMTLNLFGMIGKKFTMGDVVFYTSYGYIVKIITLVLTWYIYNVIQKTKQTGAATQYHQISSPSLYFNIRKMLNLTPKQRFAKQLRVKLDAIKNNTPTAVFYTKMLVFGAVGVVSMFCLVLYSNYNARRNILTETSIQTIPTNAYNHINVLNTVLDLTGMYKNIDMSEISDEKIIYDINERIVLTNMYVKNAMVVEVRNRVIQYQRIKFRWWQLVLVLIGVFAGCIPLWDLNYVYSIYKKNRKNELKLFQIIILLNKDFPTATTLSILDDMESQSLYYKPILLQALNDYQNDSQRALHLLKTEKDEAFQNIVNNLISIDKVGPQRAFSEIEMDIAYTEKRHQLERHISDDTEKALLDILSVIPCIVVVGGYFILPFVLDSWRDLKDVFDLFRTF